jgi:hypothetical protein
VITTSSLEQSRICEDVQRLRIAIERIGRYTAHLDEATFTASELHQDAVVKNLRILHAVNSRLQRFEHPMSRQLSAFDIHIGLPLDSPLLEPAALWKTTQTVLSAFSKESLSPTRS